MIYAVGDVHGCLGMLRRLLDRVQDHAADRGVDRPRVVFLGDYVDRGLNSKGVLDLLCSDDLRQRFDPVILRGNHDQYMLQAWRGQLVGKSLFSWLAGWGGVETVESYGVEAGRRAIDDFMPLFRAAVPEAHIRLLQGLELTCRGDGLYFCHAGIKPNVPLDQQSERDLLFGAPDFLAYSGDHGARIVHGHWATDDVIVLPNRICVNTGAGYPGGRLAAVAIEGRDAEVL